MSPAMTGIEKITERILADARESAKEILAKAQQDCNDTAAAFAERAERECAALSRQAMEQGEELVTRARSAAAMARRNILLEARAKILDEAFEAAKREVCDTDYGKYRELLIALLSCALLEQSKNERRSKSFGDEVEEVDRFEVLLNAKDRERFGTTILEGARRVTERRIGAEKTAKLVLSEKVADIDGGLILRYGDVEANCSIAVLLAEMRHSLEGRISAILFEQ